MDLYEKIINTLPENGIKNLTKINSYKELKLLRKIIVAVLALLMSISLCGCFLLPEEAKMPELPLVTPFSGAEYTTAYVTKGDLIYTENIICTYSATQSENLAFNIDGELYGSIFVEAGDYVTAGTLVAELDVSSILEEIEARDTEILKAEIELAKEYKALELALLSEEVAGGVSTVASEAKQASITYKENSLAILNEKKAELIAKLEARRLYASMDGTVTYTKTLIDGSKATKNETVVTITNMDSSVFIASTPFYKYFTPGQEVTVVSDNVEYTAVYTEASELGLEENIDKSGAKVVYFVITGAEAPATSKAKGIVKLLIDSREAALMLPKRAVFTVDGKYMVFYQDANGVKSAKEIQCGLVANGFIEIVSGLNEGDCVIIG
jgi:multidrug efflux pump subunit AcrA (membrane-fusion protein)